MKAMILAAGIGSRLRPLTNKIPKALIEINGTPILEIVIKRLIEAGVRELVINLHHKSQMIVDFLKAKENFGLCIEISHEKKLLDTGGALKKVAPFFNDDQPFFLHNVDVLSNMNLRDMYLFHQKNSNLATLAVSKRKSDRYLIFDREGLLCGWQRGTDTAAKPLGTDTNFPRKLVSVPAAVSVPLAFNGIHVVSPKTFSFMDKQKDSFPIIETYIKAVSLGEKIQAFCSDSYLCQDIGTLAKLKSARASWA